MSDYMFMLESHLSPEQNQVVSLVQTAAEQLGLTAFLTGGAMRDMLGGFPIRDLDFTVEGNALKLVKALARNKGRTLSKDQNRRSAEMRFPGCVTAQIAMAHEARFPRPGAKPRVQPATIHEDLRGRDFTINSIALSLNRASRGLLLDPTNGLGDLERRELRANGNYTLYDDPSRILRMWRFQVRTGFRIEERTQGQYENVREAQLERKIPTAAFLAELRLMADEPNPGQLLETLDREGLLGLFSPVLTGSKLNLSGFAKWFKARQMVPFGIDFQVDNLGLFLFLLGEKLSPRDKTQLIKDLRMRKSDVQSWRKLEARAKKLEQTLKSPKLKKASLVYQALRPAPGDLVLFLLMRSPRRLVHDRIRNYLQKYLPLAEEITDRDLIHTGLKPGTPKFEKAKQDYIHARLDGRIRKPASPPEPEPVPAAAPRR